MNNNYKIVFIAAASENKVIGKDGTLPWHLPEDLKFFKEKTLNQVVLMGRLSFESIPNDFKPLTQRFNIVATKKGFSYEHSSVSVVNDVDDFINEFKLSGFSNFDFIPEAYRENTELWITGGGEIFFQYIEKVDEIHLTVVHDNVEGDTFFPEIPNNFRLFSNPQRLASINSLEYSHCHYVRP